MVCYLQGVTPSSGNEKKDTVNTNQKINLSTLQSDIEKRRLEFEILKQQKRFIELSKEAAKTLNQFERMKLEETEHALLQKKEELERQLKILQMPKDYQSMSTSSLFTELWNAINTNSPDKYTINNELHKRLAQQYMLGQ